MSDMISEQRFGGDWAKEARLFEQVNKDLHATVKQHNDGQVLIRPHTGQRR
jgi:hypothetical protein